MGRGGTRPYREAPRVWPPLRRHFWLVSQQGNNGTGWNPSLPGSIFYFDYFDVVTTLLAMAKGSPPYVEVGRKTPARGAHIFSGQPNFFFVTVNAKDRVQWMAQAQVQSSLVRIWRDKATAWLVGYYMIMPEHLHLFCAPHDLHFGIDAWVAYWKSSFSREHVGESWAFQRGSFHHRLRSQEEYHEKWIYAQENPLRRHLVVNQADWPYQGTVYDLSWW